MGVPGPSARTAARERARDPELLQAFLDDPRDHRLLLRAVLGAHGELDDVDELVERVDHQALALLRRQVGHVGQHLLEVGPAVLLEVDAVEERAVLARDLLQAAVHEGIDGLAQAPAQEAVDAAEHLVELLDDVFEVQLALLLAHAFADGRRLPRLSAADHAEHLQRPEDAAGLEVREVAHVADPLDGRAAVDVAEDLLLLLAEVQAEVRVVAAGGHVDGLDVAQGADDLAPGVRVADALQDQVLGGHVQRGDVVVLQLPDDERVLALHPGEEVHEDALDVQLDGGDQLLRFQGGQIHQDGPELETGPDALGGFQEAAYADLALREQDLPHALVLVVAGRVGHAAVEDEDLLERVAVLDGEDAGLAAVEDRAHQLGHAGRLDVPADDEVVVLVALGFLAHEGERPKNALSQSMGTGKMMVEFFSAAISVSVWR